MMFITALSSQSQENGIGVSGEQVQGTMRNWYPRGWNTAHSNTIEIYVAGFNNFRTV